MITYKNFIAELKSLVGDAQSLRDARDIHENPKFRKWRHEVQSLLDQIVRAGYLLPGQVRIDKRYFGYTPRIATDDECFSFYQRDIDDSINELELIVRNYEKFGEPKRDKQEDITGSCLQLPEKITLPWIWHNANVSFWIWVSGILLSTFLFGIYVGQSTFYAQLNMPWHPPVSGGVPAVPDKKPPSGKTTDTVYETETKLCPQEAPYCKHINSNDNAKKASIYQQKCIDWAKSNNWTYVGYTSLHGDPACVVKVPRVNP